MALTEPKKAELLDLLWSLYDHSLPADAAARLDAWLAEDAEARLIQARFFLMCGLLHWRASERPQPFPPSPTDEEQIADIWEKFHSIATNYMALSLLISGLVMTILLLSMALIVPEWKQLAADRPPERPVFVAEISNTQEAIWDQSSDGNFKNKDLLSGDRLVLNSGLAEITFGDGTQVVLKGPAELVVNAASRGTLKEGILTANVPQRAIGFRIDTPQAIVTDLGTAFGVLVVPEQFSELYVYEGAVDCAPSDGASFPSQIVAAGDAVRIHGQQLSPLAAEQVRPKLVISAPSERPGFYLDFARDRSAMSLAGDALYLETPVSGDIRCLRLTDNQSNRLGAAWYSEKLPVADGFSTALLFQFSSVRGVPADGMALVVQNQADADQLVASELGPNDRGLSISIDVFQNEGDPETPYVAVLAHKQRLVSASLADVVDSGTLSDSRPHILRVDYRDGKLYVRVDGRLVIRDLPVNLTDLPGGAAVDADGNSWIGFTARTGSSGQNHDLLKWEFSSYPPTGQ